MLEQAKFLKEEVHRPFFLIPALESRLASLVCPGAPAPVCTPALVPFSLGSSPGHRACLYRTLGSVSPFQWMDITPEIDMFVHFSSVSDGPCGSDRRGLPYLP